MIERKDGSGSFPLYEVWIDGQGPFVARKDVFNQAQGLLGAQVDAITRTEQKGDWTNHYLDFIEHRAGPMQNPAVVAQQAQYGNGQQQQTYQPSQPATSPIMTAQAVVSEPTEAEIRKQTSIHRQTSTKVAALISKNAQEFWVNVQDLVHFYEMGVMPYQNHPVTPDPIPRQNAQAYQQYRDEPANQYVPQAAYADPGPQGIPHSDDDIPF